MSTIGFIGVGEIASAIIEGLNSRPSGSADDTGLPERLLLSPRNARRTAHLAETIEHAEACDSNQEVVDGSDLIVLAVLPQHAVTVLDGLDIPAEKTVVSAVAGVSAGELAVHLPNSPTIVRVIPLPAVRERSGVTAVFPANRDVEEIFDALGGTVVAGDEAQFSTLSAATATMSAHFAFLTGIADWLEAQG